MPTHILDVQYMYALTAIVLTFSTGGGINKQEREVTVTLKHGVEAKNYDDVRLFHI